MDSLQQLEGQELLAVKGDQHNLLSALSTFLWALETLSSNFYTLQALEMIYELLSHKHSFVLFAGHFTAVAGNALTPSSLEPDQNFTFVFC